MNDAGRVYIQTLALCQATPGAAPVTGRYGPEPLPLFLVGDADLTPLPGHLKQYDCRSNRLLLTLLKRLEAWRRGVDPARIGVVMGTSSSGIAAGEEALSHYHRLGRMPECYHHKQQELGGMAEFAARWLGAEGPAYVISSSCASSAQALASARRLLRMDLCDRVFVGGVEVLSATTVQGFDSLGALSRTCCNPFSRNRDGTVLGEGGALLVLSREPGTVALLGVGMSSDAYHLSAPDPSGQGAALAMTRALDDAGLAPEQIGYLNLHGTGTLQNDAMEALAVAAVFGDRGPPCSSTKPLTGHCLGAGGALEAALCVQALLEPEKPLPPHRWDGCRDRDLPRLQFTGGRERIEPARPFCMSNTYAFGGANVSVILGRIES